MTKPSPLSSTSSSGYASPSTSEAPAAPSSKGTDSDTKPNLADSPVTNPNRDSDDIKAKRVVDPDAPFDYASTTDTGPDHQGNAYPPSKAALEADADAAEARVEALRAQADVEEEAATAARALADAAE